MTNYEAVKNLTCDQMENYLDQVFLTGMNTGHQSLVDPDIHEGNPFNADWLNGDAVGPPALVEDEAGEGIIIEQLVKVVSRIVEFDVDAIPDDLNWQMQVVLPKSQESAEEFCDSSLYKKENGACRMRSGEQGDCKTDMTIRDRIQSELSAIEEREGLTILLAVESGSRAWGFPSPDSDYDVRFLYVRPRNYYLNLEKRRDVYELPPDELLDINGWDFDKTLRLLHSSNPTLFEWMSSPIIYRKHHAYDELMKNAQEYFMTKPGLYHYLHMADSNYREYLKADMVKLKKYFYVLRPILACRHILQNGTPPPMLFQELVKMQMEESLIPEIEDLLMMKEKTSEMGLAPKRQVLNDYIEESLEVLIAAIDEQPSQQKKPWSSLNEVFLQALELAELHS